jgi:hypothetical protein
VHTHSEVPYTGDKGVDVVGAILSAVGMGGVVLGILVWQEGGEFVGLLIALSVASLVSLTWWLRRRKREGKPALLDPDLFKSKYFRLGISSQTCQQIALGGMMIALPIFLQMVLEYNALEAGVSLAPLSLSMFAVALLAGRKAGNRSPSKIILTGFVLLAVGVARVAVPPVHARSRCEQGTHPRGAGTGLEGAREERRGDDQHAPRRLARGSACGREGRDPSHQYEGAAAGAADRVADPAPCCTAWSVERDPDDATSRPGAFGRGGESLSRVEASHPGRLMRRRRFELIISLE